MMVRPLSTYRVCPVIPAAAGDSRKQTAAATSSRRVGSLLALVRAVLPALAAGSSVVALTYHGSQKCMPGYNMMGIAKAALESACRYLAYELGSRGIRVNCASPGALLTLSSSAFPDIQENIERAAASSPLRVPAVEPRGGHHRAPLLRGEMPTRNRVRKNRHRCAPS